MLDILEIFLKKRTYKYLRMDGGTNVGNRQAVVNQFNTVRFKLLNCFINQPFIIDDIAFEFQAIQCIVLLEGG